MAPTTSKGKAGGVRKPKDPVWLFITGPDGKQYRVNRKTGQVQDAAGNIVAGASYEGSTGNFSLPGHDPIDTLPELGEALLGSVYERNFKNKNFVTVVDPADGTVYYANKKTGKVFSKDHRYVGMFDSKTGGLDIQWTPRETDDPDTEPEPDPDEEPDDDLSAEQESILDLLRGFLLENELPESLLDWIKTALQEGKGQQQILAELYETPEFLAAYPEIAMRKENGLEWMPPALIRQQRDEIRRISQQLLGVAPSVEQITGLIGNGVSLTEWESRIDTHQRFLQYGPLAKTFLEEELGEAVTDEMLWDFLAFEIPTPELNVAYENSLYRFFRAQSGLGIGPRDETEILRQFGVDVEQAFKGYQGIAAELPRAERLAAIEKQIQGTSGLPDTGNDVFNETPYATLFRAIQLNDAEAMRTLRAQMARDTARFRQQGSVATDQSGRATGLLTPGERR